VDWLTEPFQFAFMRMALLGALLVGVSCATVGVYVVYRRLAFMGNAVAHTVLPGVAVAIILGGSLLLGAMVAAIVTSLAIALTSSGRAVREDTAIGVVFSAMFALGVLLISTRDSFRDLTGVLFGNVLGITTSDLVVIAAIAALVVLVAVAFHKELELTTADPVHAAAIGLNPEWIRFGLLILLAPVVVAGIQAVGIIMVTALLVTPAATASLLTGRLVPMILTANAVAALSAFIGLLVSYHFDASSGAAIVLSASGLFAVAWTIDRVRRIRSGRTMALPT
jgi:ABC-type Mn2+/Zn2+ transport system permease subunit